MSAAIQDILHRIELLQPEDRMELHARLAELFEVEWASEISVARVKAKENHVDDSAIEAAIARVRYGK